ncbi:hypothetical protein LAUMK13_00952 [Mycobacterium innocens]|uniref:Uncharacterized protein n=1 Tax=Mycobacterium innocens TaxID=2341083 RepID=A0A498PQV0_9MYCO|nr:hypothetical protein LAUMK13_00952 [Mycobacterium innocens]
MHDMVHPAQLVERLIAQRELRKLADQRLGSLTPLGRQAFETSQRLTADQHPHLRGGPGIEQTRDDTATKKPGTAGNDISHAAHRGGWRPHPSTGQVKLRMPSQSTSFQPSIGLPVTTTRPMLGSG